MSSMDDVERDRYWSAVETADKQLEARIAEIRRQEDLRQLTVREAADARIQAMTEHLAVTSSSASSGWAGPDARAHGR